MIKDILNALYTYKVLIEDIKAKSINLFSVTRGIL